MKVLPGIARFQLIMTTNYTQEEWQAMFDEAEQHLPSTRIAHEVPRIGSASFSKMIDHTLLKTEATAEQITNICDDAIRQNFISVCVRLEWVDRAIQRLQGSRVVVACVVGFHEGTQSPDAKATEAAKAVNAGAKELDMVLNWPLLKAKRYSEVYSDIAAVRNVAPLPVVLKVILETSQLSPHEIIAGCKIAEAAGADYVKTSTGFNGQGATQENVALMKNVIGDRMKVKASGGIKTVNDCVSMLEAGAERIGTSNGVGIMDEARQSFQSFA